MNRKLFDYIKASPTPLHAVAHTAKLLEENGFSALSEGDEWKIECGKKYYVTRNGSSLIAFKMPESDFSGFMMTAAHCDSPCFKIKENAAISDGHYVRLSTEKYGGMLCSSWMDRPLSIAGRAVIRTENGIECRLVELSGINAVIPNVAIHMNRNANDSASFNPAVDMLPLYSECSDLESRLAENLSVNADDIMSTDLFLFNPQDAVEWNGFISAPRLDDLQCAFGALTAFTSSKGSDHVQVFCLFDNEEVGSQTKQGAASTFLFDVLSRINAGDNEAFRRRIANSFLVSCDNAHAVHPNHGEYADKNHSVYMNKGIVIKYNANQKYTSDGVSSAIFKLVCQQCGVPFQMYANRADMAGGSTLGNIANTQVSLNTVDIGLPQLAMHSAFETAGAADTQYLVTALTAFYEKSLKMQNDGNYILY